MANYQDIHKTSQNSIRVCPRCGCPQIYYYNETKKNTMSTGRIIFLILLACTTIGLVYDAIYLLSRDKEITTTYGVCQYCGNKFIVQNTSGNPTGKLTKMGDTLGTVGIYLSVFGIFLCITPIGALFGLSGLILGIIGLLTKEKTIKLPTISSVIGVITIILSIVVTYIFWFS